MPIVCPHCATAYNLDAEKLGAGRSVRCARCKEVWMARPEPLLVMATELEWLDHAASRSLPPPLLDNTGMALIDSPPLASDWPAGETGTSLMTLPTAQVVDVAPAPVPAASGRRTASRRRTERRNRSLAQLRLPTSVAAMGGLIAALLMWRTDVVRLMPQTAMFYKTIGLDVNLRGLSFRDVKLGSETVDGQPVLTVEGVIIDSAKQSVEIPRLRFVVRDAKGAAVYAWDASSEQSAITPGQRVSFRSRLAQPPGDAHSIDVRFFNKRDLAAGAA